MASAQAGAAACHRRRAAPGGARRAGAGGGRTGRARASRSQPCSSRCAPRPRRSPKCMGSTGLEDDAEMREIFIEEAREVLQGAREALARLGERARRPGRPDAVRRAFHTLKGSSRMVGLKDFGEAAWACEQLYNTRLAESSRLDGDARRLHRRGAARPGRLGRGHRRRPPRHAHAARALSARADALRLGTRRQPAHACGRAGRAAAECQRRVARTRAPVAQRRGPGIRPAIWTPPRPIACRRAAAHAAPGDAICARSGRSTPPTLAERRASARARLARLAPAPEDRSKPCDLDLAQDRAGTSRSPSKPAQPTSALAQSIAPAECPAAHLDAANDLDTVAGRMPPAA